MKKLLIFVLFGVIFGLSSGLDVKSCSSSLKTPKSVDIKGCTKAPCKIYKGTDLTIDISFQTTDKTRTLKPQIYAKIFGLRFPIKLPAEHENVCEHLKEGKCPLEANQAARYFIEVPVLKSYPSMKTEIEINLIGDNNKNHVCFKIDGQLA